MKCIRKEDVDILVLPIEVISLLSSDALLHLILENIRVEDLRRYDLIIVPGLIRGSTDIIENAIGVPVVKGTIHALDVVDLLCMDPKELLALSREQCADVVLEAKRYRELELLLEEKRLELEKKCPIKIGNTCIPLRPPPLRVVSIIRVSKENLGFIDELIERICCADIIGVSVDDEDLYMEFVKVLRDRIDKPLLAEVSRPSQLEKLIPYVDGFINVYPSLFKNLSISNGDKERLFLSVLPFDPLINIYPDLNEKVKYGIENISKLRSMGFRNLALDLVLEPYPNIMRSLNLYYEASKHIEVPLQMNLSNVVETIDADSIGVIALLSYIALELGISLLTVYENEGKGFEITRISCIASTLPLKRGRYGGPDLLVLREQRYRETVYTVPSKAEIIDLDKEEALKLHSIVKPSEIFKIRIDRRKHNIEVLYIGKKGVKLLRSSSVDRIMNKIAELGLVSDVSHAMYLGYELSKAEIALCIGKSYIQDMSLFKPLNERIKGLRRCK